MDALEKKKLTRKKNEPSTPYARGGGLFSLKLLGGLCLLCLPCSFTSRAEARRFYCPKGDGQGELVRYEVKKALDQGLICLGDPSFEAPSKQLEKDESSETSKPPKAMLTAKAGKPRTPKKPRTNPSPEADPCEDCEKPARFGSVEVVQQTGLIRLGSMAVEGHLRQPRLPWQGKNVDPAVEAHPLILEDEAPLPDFTSRISQMGVGP